MPKPKFQKRRYIVEVDVPFRTTHLQIEAIIKCALLNAFDQEQNQMNQGFVHEMYFRMSNSITVKNLRDWTKQTEIRTKAVAHAREMHNIYEQQLLNFDPLKKPRVMRGIGIVENKEK